jgi:succinate dehydrogenase / fumarate reductase cytochrome b subunit
MLRLFTSSIGKKFLMALTGLFLCTYLVVHLAGNLLLLRQDGGASFDAYAEFLPSLLIVRIIEIGLFAVFILHIVSGLNVWWQNRRARPEKYSSSKPQENSSFFSRTMFLSGSIVFIFLFFHLKTFWVTSRFQHDANPSMYAIAVEAFSSPYYSWFYVLAIVLLAFHLRHGFQSAFQTFGLKTQTYAPFIEAVGVIFWLVIPIGFAIIPIYFFYSTCHWFH